MVALVASCLVLFSSRSAPTCRHHLAHPAKVVTTFSGCSQVFDHVVVFRTRVLVQQYVYHFMMGDQSVSTLYI